MAERRKTVNFSEETPQVFEYEKVDLPPEEKKENQDSAERKKWFMEYMSASMGIRIPESKLDEVSFEGVARFIVSGKCSKIITMTGAGISTSAGIADYRSPITGLYDLLREKNPNMKSVKDLFDIQMFIKDPYPFFERSKRFFQHALKPTPCHYFIRLLHEKGLLLRHFTQNIDTLERLAGIPEDKVVEAHGSYYTSHCMYCEREYSFEWMEERIVRDEIPKCEDTECNGVIKPDIVMFGENLSERFAVRAEEDSLNCDLLIILGTSLAVLPFSSLTSKVRVDVPRLYINNDRGKTSRKHPMVDILSGGSFDFDAEDNYRDVYKEAKCDDAVYQLADLIGWGDELRALVESENERFQEEWKAKGKSPPAAEPSELPPAESAETESKSPTTEKNKASSKQTASTGKNAKTVGGTGASKSGTVVNGKSPRSSTSSVNGKSGAGAGSHTKPAAGKGNISTATAKDKGGKPAAAAKK